MTSSLISRYDKLSAKYTPPADLSQSVVNLVNKHAEKWKY